VLPHLYQLLMLWMLLKHRVGMLLLVVVLVLHVAGLHRRMQHTAYCCSGDVEQY
jgi:hypothetical protein